jgi:hypothetical protein
MRIEIVVKIANKIKVVMHYVSKATPPKILGK